MSTLLRCILLFLFAAGGASRTDAQWVVIPIGDERAAHELLDEVRPALAAAHIEVADDVEATEVFEAEVSAPAQSLSQSDIDEWANRSRSALRALARADYPTARADLLEAQRVAEQAAEELNREAARAQQVLDTCLFMARTLIETGDRPEALRQVRTCRVLVPEVEPQEHFHTPEVHELLDRVDSEPQAGTLRVTSTPSGCVARLNGVAQQETPLNIEGLGRGTYRVQVECDQRRGRVRRIEVISDEGTEVNVDLGLDAVVHSQPFVYLENSHRVSAHIGAIARDLGRTTLFVEEVEGNLLLTRADPTGDVTRALTTREHLPRAIDALREQRSMDFSGPEPRPFEPEEDPLVATVSPPIPEAADRRGLPAWRIGLGIGLGAAGVGAIAVAARLQRFRAARGDQFGIAFPTDSDYLLRQQRYQERRSDNTAIVGLALAGGTLMGVGVSLLVPPDEGVPWWSWALGGVGVALVGTAGVVFLTRGDCVDLNSPEQSERQACVDRDQRGPLAGLLVGASLPFFAVPVSSLLQQTGAEVSLSAAPSAEGMMLSMEGRF